MKLIIITSLNCLLFKAESFVDHEYNLLSIFCQYITVKKLKKLYAEKRRFVKGQKKVYMILYLIFGPIFIKLKNNVSINRNITFCYLQPLKTGKNKKLTNANLWL